MIRLVAAWLVAALLGGCAQNAIVELELDLPAKSGEVAWAFVQARSGTRDFADEWAGSDPLEGLALGEVRRQVLVGIEADDAEELDRPLLVKIRYCRSTRCSDPADGAAQEVRITIERAFYRGEYTRVELRDPLPDVCAAPCAPTEHIVRKCDVQGCRAGVTARYCDADDRHFCE